jgi:hypothetical protein
MGGATTAGSTNAEAFSDWLCRLRTLALWLSMRAWVVGDVDIVLVLATS